MMNTKKDFWKKVDIKSKNECWEWMGRIKKDGYGQFDFKHKGKLVHRLSFLFTFGKLPIQLEVCHTCNNRKCCNPRHLYLGTHKENMRQMVDEKRSFHPTGENYGAHKLKSNEILKIRELYNTGLYSYNDIAKQYNVTRQNIFYIIKEKTWKHVE